MTIKISIEGANVQEVLGQMLSILNIPAPDAQAPTPVQAANGVDKSAKPAPTTVLKKPVGRPPKATTATPAPVADTSLTAEPAPTDAPADAPAPEAPPEKSADDIKHDAIVILKKVYTKGQPGQAKVDEVLKQFGVQKFVDVPVTRAVELLQTANRALYSLEN